MALDPAVLPHPDKPPADGGRRGGLSLVCKLHWRMQHDEIDVQSRAAASTQRSTEHCCRMHSGKLEQDS